MIRHVFLSLVFILLVGLTPPAAQAYGAGEIAELSYNLNDFSYQSAVEEAQAVKAAARTPKAVPYIVNAGDTLYKIANSFGSTVASIQTYNDISDPNTLSIGQKLMIPAAVQKMPLVGGREAVVEKVLSSTLTAYTAGVESTGKTPSHPQYGITYSGVRAEEGRTVAVDPKVIPLGSTVYIEGIGIRKAEDTGSAIKGAKIDVFMNDVQEALTFGVKKNVKVYVLSEA